eukprot:scaffold53898_cov42-Phaeocystis_antarctica.AAC.2
MGVQGQADDEVVAGARHRRRAACRRRRPPSLPGRVPREGERPGARTMSRAQGRCGRGWPIGRGWPELQAACSASESARWPRPEPPCFALRSDRST